MASWTTRLRSLRPFCLLLSVARWCPEQLWSVFSTRLLRLQEGSTVLCVLGCLVCSLWVLGRYTERIFLHSLKQRNEEHRDPSLAVPRDCWEVLPWAWELSHFLPHSSLCSLNNYLKMTQEIFPQDRKNFNIPRNLPTKDFSAFTETLFFFLKYALGWHRVVLNDLSKIAFA